MPGGAVRSLCSLTRTLALALAVAALGAVAVPGSAAARTAGRSGLHNARYCEIIALDHAPPDATATVWNTIGQNDCPAAWWNAFDAGTLAKQIGASLVVLNGPRYFLMDFARGEVGPVRTFNGQKLTEVATIPIPTAAELARAPYTDRTITRSNIWRWKRGRTVYQLVAPGGDVYVMQSYSQILDPNLTIKQLRTLGSRLKLPAGWKYRVRRLKRPLELGAEGSATIIQDDLQNTYQLARTTRPPGKRKRRVLKLTGVTRNVPPTVAGTVEDRGTVSGAPFGDGSVVIVGSLSGGKLTATFRLLFPGRGSVTGTADMPFKISGNQISFRGTAQLTGGTGAYRGITSGTLRARDTNTLDGQNGRVFVSGHVRY